jgi:hypothetical protein
MVRMKRGGVKGIPEFAAEAGCTTNNRPLRRQSNQTNLLNEPATVRSSQPLWPATRFF